MSKIYLNNTASSRVKQCLKRKGITQEVFAEEHLQVTLRTFQNWLVGKTPITFEKLDMLQKLCCISIKDLFGEVPKEYASTTRTFMQIIKQFSDMGFVNSVLKNYKNYTDWLMEMIHFHPYPTNECFHIIEHNIEKNGKNFYNDISIIIPNKTLPVGSLFVIGFIYIAGRMRFDYGQMTVRDGHIEVKESFMRNSYKYTLPIDKEKFAETGVLFQIATWFGTEDCTFVVRSKDENFLIESNGEIQEKEEDILKMRGVHKVVFQRVVWQENK